MLKIETSEASARPSPAKVPATMKAAMFRGTRGKIAFKDVPVPEIGEFDALIKVTACGVCRTDWHIWNGDWDWAIADAERAMILGHEVGGVIVAIGEGVRSVAIGDRITTPFGHACGKCGQCLRGHQNRCEQMFFPSIQETGGWAEYMVVRDADLNAVRLPDKVDDLAAAALGCRYMTAFHAIRDRGELKGGETVAVVGCGGVGLATIEIAVALGGRVIAVDIDDERLERARKMGAFAAVNAKGLDPMETGAAIKGFTRSGKGADICVDAVGGTKTFHSAFHGLQKGGRLVAIGMTGQEEKGIVPLPIDFCVMLELNICGCSGIPIHGYDELLALVADGKLAPAALVNKTISLSQVEQALEEIETFQATGYIVIDNMTS